MELKVTSVAEPKEADSIIAKKYPTIHFAGRSTSSGFNGASLRGTVRMAEDRTIRWSWVSGVTKRAILLILTASEIQGDRA